MKNLKIANDIWVIYARFVQTLLRRANSFFFLRFEIFLSTARMSSFVIKKIISFLFYVALKFLCKLIFWPVTEIRDNKSEYSEREMILSGEKTNYFLSCFICSCYSWYFCIFKPRGKRHTRSDVIECSMKSLSDRFLYEKYFYLRNFWKIQIIFIISFGKLFRGINYYEKKVCVIPLLFLCYFFCDLRDI